MTYFGRIGSVSTETHLDDVMAIACNLQSVRQGEEQIFTVAQSSGE